MLYGPLRQCRISSKGTFSHKEKAAEQFYLVVKGLKSNLLGLLAITALRLTVRVNYSV